MNDSQIATATIADFSLPAAIVSIGLCAITSPATISKYTKQATAALGLSDDKKKTPAEKMASLQWLIDNVANKSAPVTVSMFDSIPAPAIENEIDELPVDLVVTSATDLTTVDTVDALAEYKQTECFEPVTTDTIKNENMPIGINTDLSVDTATPSNVARLTESFSNEMALAPIQIRHVSHLNQSMQVIINDGVITDIKQTHALALEFRQIANKHARRVGELLLQVKAELNHGEFLPWLAENVDVSIRQAQNYMRDAKGLPPKLRTIGKYETVAYLNPPADLVAQAESLETKTLRLEYEKLQNELLAAKQVAADLLTKIRFANVQADGAKQQADELRANQAAIIDAKVSAAIANQVEPAPATIETVLPIEPPAELNLIVEVGAVTVDNTAIEEVHYCLETIENHLRAADFSDKWRVALAEYKRIGAIFESLDNAIIDGVIAE